MGNTSEIPVISFTVFAEQLPEASLLRYCRSKNENMRAKAELLEGREYKRVWEYKRKYGMLKYRAFQVRSINKSTFVNATCNVYGDPW